MNELSGKVAVITGAGAGMGRATASLFASRGAKVVAADISGAEAELADLFPDAVLPYRCDVRDEIQVEAMIAKAAAHFGRLDAVLNVAGFGIPGLLADAEMTDYDAMLDVDLRGVIHGTKHAIRAMTASGGGVILNWASVAAFGATRNWGLYSAGKAGVVAITKAAALENALSGIRANVIAPGTIRTEAFAQMPQELSSQLMASIPAGRFGHTEEVAELAAFLVSDRAKFISGAIIPIDGAQTAQLA
ncbi:SDR family NAD(P)-dependent oxidoreductase [Novosphingobium album (ex Hu et al. 2023)]|uniref:SDR family oxidoreductase n=1 Tax=Novosphingobium album (ex Hu et al. 2023) TaxID=2930093 RepID=A0ABT0B5C4_9SPHN|nr:SDR family oxidoreductase [Novosphingobium album (ex Hu et al. 2023)]MCJ2180244.1 SDR family oxidoreductase [Novosphingobium album (ex Hu et al. 2023)]